MSLSLLSVDTVKLVNQLFGPDDRAIACRLLAEHCGANLPFLKNADSVELERYRFAALKLSNGTVDGLGRAIELAKTDWRDLLVAAGFGSDVNAHKAWLRTTVYE
jgi:hypothetical protein